MRNEEILHEQREFESQGQYAPKDLLAMFGTSIGSVNEFTDHIIQSVQDGHTSALKARIWCKSMEMCIERINKETAQNQMSEAEKFGPQKFTHAGAEITIADVYTSYNYERCNDPVYNRLKSVAKFASESVKEREEFLKTIKAPITIVDEATAEVATILPPQVTRKSGLKIFIK